MLKAVIAMKLIANWRGLWHGINAKIFPKAASEKAQAMMSENRYIYLSIDFFRQSIILTLLVSTGNNMWALFLVHPVSHTSATALRYHQVFMQFSLHV